jgi:putative methyltransferase (TIGR04325 family)
MRITQVRVTSAFFVALARIPAMQPVLEGVGRIPGVERMLVGFRRGFATREEAEICAAKYGFLEHEHPGAIYRHLALAVHSRPSDYAVMFHLERMLPEVKRLMDLGGNIGNLYYSYSRYLKMPAEFRWVVVESPPVVEAGIQLTKERGEQRLQFVTSLKDARAQELDRETVLLVSGALHYFEQPLGDMLAEAEIAPTYVIVNRSPVLPAGSVIGIQDGGTYVTTARILDRRVLIASMQEKGYRVMDEWVAAELNMRLPLRPRSSVESYSGFLFARTETE